MRVVIEERTDGRYFIGLTNGEVTNFIFHTSRPESAEDCANELRNWVEDLHRRRRAWPLHEIPKIR